MKENTLKREGLAMGRYRQIDIANHPLARGIKWAEEGKWITCLGVPIGNELNVAKWWRSKIAEVRTKSLRWTALLRASYAGRNLIVQGCYLGRLRTGSTPSTCPQKYERWYRPTPTRSGGAASPSYLKAQITPAANASGALWQKIRL